MIPSQLLDKLLERQHPLRTARVLTGLSLRDVEDASGVSRTQLSRIERNQITPTPAERSQIADALSLDVEDVFPPGADIVRPDPVPEVEPEMTEARRVALEAALRWIEWEGRKLQMDDDQLVQELRFRPGTAALVAADFHRLADASRFLSGGTFNSLERAALRAAQQFTGDGGTGWRLSDAQIAAQLRSRTIGEVITQPFPELLRERAESSVWEVLPAEERARLLTLAETRRAAAKSDPLKPSTRRDPSMERQF